MAESDESGQPVDLNLLLEIFLKLPIFTLLLIRLLTYFSTMDESPLGIPVEFLLLKGIL
jgi:hypothetical protein